MYLFLILITVCFGFLMILNFEVKLKNIIEFLDKRINWSVLRCVFDKILKVNCVGSFFKYFLILVL